MKTLALLLTLAVGMTQAQVTTLAYDGEDTTGSYNSLVHGATALSGPFAFDATFDARIVLSGSLANHDLRLVSASISAGSFGPLDFGQGGPIGSPNFCNTFGCLDLSIQNGQITGATADFNSSSYHGSSEKFSVGPKGDSLLYQFGSTRGACENLVVGHQTYTGATIKYCNAYASSSGAGDWTVTTVKAPEIGPASAAGGLTLLFGALAVLRSKRKSSDLEIQIGGPI